MVVVFELIGVVVEGADAGEGVRGVICIGNDTLGNLEFFLIVAGLVEGGEVDVGVEVVKVDNDERY